MLGQGGDGRTGLHTDGLSTSLWYHDEGPLVSGWPHLLAPEASWVRPQRLPGFEPRDFLMINKEASRFEYVRTLSGSSQSQNFKSDIGQQNTTMCIRTNFKTYSVSLVSFIQSWHVTPFFANTESQESKSDITSCNRTRQCVLRLLLNLWCPSSNFDISLPPLSLYPSLSKVFIFPSIPPQSSFLAFNLGTIVISTSCNWSQISR